jgi:glycosyltransferase involved in cell wall biosynthesis
MTSELRVVVVLKTAEGAMWTVPLLEGLRQRGHRVMVVLPAAGALRDVLRARNFTTVESAFSFSFRPSPGTLLGLWRLRRQLRLLRPDVLHYHLYASALASRLSSVGMKLARVHMVAGPLYLESRLIRWAERLLSRLDDVTIGGSDYTSRLYRALGRSQARTPAIAYGIDTDWFVPPTPEERAKARADFGATDETFVAIMVAYVYPPRRSVHRGHGIKGHDLLLEAWQIFARARPEVRLVLVGSGFRADGERHRLELISRFGVARDPSITWLDTVDDVRECYRAADISVSPSLSENHGAALEAGAMGLPRVVSDAGALPESVDLRSGWIVPRGDVGALVAALESAHAAFLAGTLPGVGACARATVVSHFDVRAGTARVVDVVEHAAGAGRR